MKIYPGIIGIDVSKHTLDIFDGSIGTSVRIANEAAAIAARVTSWIDALVVFEATGRYDGKLRRALQEAGIRFARVNPSRARLRRRPRLAGQDRRDRRAHAGSHGPSARAHARAPARRAPFPARQPAQATRSAGRHPQAGKDPALRRRCRLAAQYRAPHRLALRRDRCPGTPVQGPHRFQCQARSPLSPAAQHPRHRPGHRRDPHRPAARARLPLAQNHRSARRPRTLQRRQRPVPRTAHDPRWPQARPRCPLHGRLSPLPGPNPASRPSSKTSPTRANPTSLPSSHWHAKSLLPPMPLPETRSPSTPDNTVAGSRFACPG
jgi:hypothetical protein